MIDLKFFFLFFLNFQQKKRKRKEGQRLFCNTRQVDKSADEVCDRGPGWTAVLVVPPPDLFQLLSHAKSLDLSPVWSKKQFLPPADKQTNKQKKDDTGNSDCFVEGCES